MNKEKNNLKDWFKAFSAVFFVLLLFRFFQSVPWLGNLGASGKNMTLGISFLIGVAASFSSCLAVVGGIVIAFSEKYKEKTAAGFWDGALWPNLKFHIGRVLTFFVLGGALGFVGGKINLSGNFVSAYSILIAAVMGWLGLSILGIVPSISRLGIKTPKFLLRAWGRLEDSEHKAAPFFLGGITFFLPCGFTQSMQIFALASGGFFAGGAAMMAFAFGTMPVLLAIGALASWAKLEKISYVSKAAGILIIFFAVYTFNSGFALLSAKKNISGNVPATEQNFNDAANGLSINLGVQKAEMKITSRGFEPNVLRVKNNIPVEFVVNGDGATGCTSKIVIPEYGIEKEIKRGENTIEFTPKKFGPIAFSCGMGMVRGKFIVE
jgi:sulfite exporter TauE/SafE